MRTNEKFPDLVHAYTHGADEWRAEELEGTCMRWVMAAHLHLSMMLAATRDLRRSPDDGIGRYWLWIECESWRLVCEEHGFDGWALMDRIGGPRVVRGVRDAVADIEFAEDELAELKTVAKYHLGQEASLEARLATLRERLQTWGG